MQRQLTVLVLLALSLLLPASNPATISHINVIAGFPSPVASLETPPTFIINYSIPVPQSSVPDAIVPGANGTLWFTEYGSGSIGEFNSTSKTFTHYNIPETGAIPTTLTFDGPDQIWFTDQNPSFPSVWMLNLAGSPTFHRFLTNATNSSPVFIISDQATKDIWFTDTTGNYLGEIDHSSLEMTKFPIPSSPSGPVEISFQNGTSYIWASEISGKISRFDMVTDTSQEFTPSVPLSYPVGIVVDKQGNIWLAEHGGSAIVEFAPGESTWRKYPTSQAFAPPGSGPATLAIDNQGRLWFAEHYVGKIGRLDPNTGTMEEFTIPFAGAYSLLNSFDEAGNFWFAMAYANSIGMISRNATASIVIRPLSTPNTVVESGKTTSAQFMIMNSMSTAVTLNLSVTSFFTTNYYTTSSEVSLSTNSLTLGPGENKTVSVVTTPDFSLQSGVYTAGIVASYGNVAAIGSFFLQVNANPWYQMQTLLPEILIVAAIATVVVVLLIRRTRTRAHGRVVAAAPKASLIAALVIVLMSLIQETGQSWAKCPGLPQPYVPPGGGNNPDYYGIALDIGSIAFFGIVAYFLIRSRLRGSA